MIKMIYNQEAYDYENVGSQPYNIKTEIEVIKDASADEVVKALVELMKVATYHSASIRSALEAVAAEMED